jgi:CRISPR-associated protein Csd1
MIIQALCQYYDRLSSIEGKNVPSLGYSREKIHLVAVLDNKGKLVQLRDIRNRDGVRSIPIEMNVPHRGKKRASGISPYFLWDNTGYVFGVDKPAKSNKLAEKHKAFIELHKEIGKSINNDELGLILKFLENWQPEQFTKIDNWQEYLGLNCVFQIEGTRRYIHDIPFAREAWINYLSENASKDTGICLVSGQKTSIEPLHPPIKGKGRIRGSDQAELSLVSFNFPATESYNKKQNINAPMSKYAASAYTAAINYLTDSTNTQKVVIGDATTVFWTERDSPIEGFMGMILDPKDDAADNADVRKFLEAVRDGKHPAEIDSDVKFYVLGLSPNAARISVRFWHVCSVGDIEKRIGQHFRDLQITRRYENDTEYPGIWQLLKETALKTENISPLLAGAVMCSILEGTAYPESLLSAVLNRIRADQNINYLRAAILKAILNRKYRIYKQGMEVSIMLDKENKNPAYLLGRLFAVLEKTQTDALGNINATIKDRFWGSVSATPKIVFPQLLKLAQSHIGKAEYGKIRDKQIEEIICDIKEFPAHFSLDEQGVFTIGYYHQRQDFFKKKESNQ